MTIPAGWGQATFLYSGTAAPTGAAHSIGFSNSGSNSAAECAESFHDVWVAQMMPLLSSSLVLDAVRVKLGPDATGPSADFNSGITGDVGGETETPQTALLVQKVTAIGGRKGRGRMFVPGVPGAIYSSSGIMSGVELAEFGTALFNFGGALTLAGLPTALLHSDATAPTLITSLTPSATAATQRRRIRR
jgi:hypothetical protein